MWRHAMLTATRSAAITATARPLSTVQRAGSAIRAAAVCAPWSVTANSGAASPAAASSLRAAARAFSTALPRRSPYFSPPPLPADLGCDNPHYEREMTRDPPGGSRSKKLLWILIAVNGVVFWWWARAGNNPAELKWMQDNFVCDLRNLSAGRYHTLLTPAFSHQSVMHFGVNMMSLYFIAPSLMAALGPARTAAVFLVGSLAGHIAFIAWNNVVRPRLGMPPTKAARIIDGKVVVVSTYDTGAVGASSGLTTLAVLLACLWPRTPLNIMFIPIPVPARLLVGGFLLFDFVASLEPGGKKLPIGHWAHLGGGALGGLYFALALRGRKWMPRPEVDSQYFYLRMAERSKILRQRQEWLNPSKTAILGASTAFNPNAPLTPGSSLLPPRPPTNPTSPPMPPKSTPRSGLFTGKFKKAPPREFSTLASSCSLRGIIGEQRRAFSTAAAQLPTSFQQLRLSAPTIAAALPALTFSSCPLSESSPLRPTDLLVRVSYASINPSDAKNALGLMKGITTWPRVMGRDFCGVVVKAGSQAQSMLGQTVFGSGGDLGFTRDGSHAQFMRLDASEVALKPNALSAQAAASVGVTYCTAASGLKRAGFSSSDLVLVTGANGGVGGAVVQLAKRAGAKVIAVVRSKSSVVPLADAHIYLSELPNGFADLPAAVQALPLVRDHAAASGASASSPHPSRLGASLIFDVLGGQTVPHLMSSLSTRGRLVCISMPLPPSPLQIDGLDLYRQELQLIGVNSLQLSVRDCADMMREMQSGFENGQLQPPADITICAPGAVGQAYADVLSVKAKGKVVIQFAG